MPLATLAITNFELEVTYAALDTNSKLVTRKKKYEIAASGVDDAARRSNAATAMDDLLTDIGAVTEAKVIGARLSEVRGTADAVTESATPHKEALLTLLPATAGAKKIPHAIVAPADSILTNGSVVITGNADVGNYLANFMSPQLCRVSDGQTIATSNPIVESRVRMVRSGSTY